MQDDIPGEAKLLYVAMTRATEKLRLSHHRLLHALICLNGPSIVGAVRVEW